MTHDDNETEQLKLEVSKLREEVDDLRKNFIPKGKRYRSKTEFFGLPLLSIALGPDPDKNEIRGHAKGVIAIGDIATGVLALGGVAFGGIAVGGVAIGVIAFGGLALSLLLACGGMAIGLVACGGCAVGLVAVGGAALGYYALGGGAFGVHVIDSMRQSPEALEFFGRFIPGLEELFKR